MPKTALPFTRFIFDLRVDAFERKMAS